MHFEFSTSNRIIFGNGTFSQVDKIAADFGKRALIVAGSGSVSLEELFKRMEYAGVECTLFRIATEPEIPTILEGLDIARAEGVNFVIGFGGGSVLDAAKAIAALMTNPGDIYDYLEVVGAGQDIPNMPVPMIAIPTTAGTGTEVTKNAVIASTQHHVKVSMRSLKMIPRVAIVDPVLTYSMPPKVTASTGMDALTQVIEGYVSKNANVMTDIVCRVGIQKGAAYLLRAYKNGQDAEARENMCLVNLFGGLALANGGLGAVHGFAGPIGGMFNVPHGEICAALLPHVMKYNVIASKELAGFEMTRSRYEEIAKWVTGNRQATIEDGVGWAKEIAKKMNIPNLKQLGIDKRDFPEIVNRAMVSSSMKKNPFQLKKPFLEAILREAY